jgi:hypothetical protein
MDHDPPSEKHSTLNLSRLYGGSNRKTSGRPSTSDGTTSATSPKKLKGTKEKEEEKEKKAKTTEMGIKDEKELGPLAVLRKRTELNGEIPTRSMQALKPGQSVLEQIGEPDHKGWMRKKGDRYNSWKSRYFVLKGPHLYILKSEDKLVSIIYYLWAGFDTFWMSRKPRSKDMSISSVTRSLRTRTPIPDVMASELCMIPTKRISSAQPNTMSFGSG